MLRRTMGTNNGKVTSVISNGYKYGEEEPRREKGHTIGIRFHIINSLEGELFSDVERFRSKEEAEEKITEYLEGS